MVVLIAFTVIIIVVIITHIRIHGLEHSAGENVFEKQVPLILEPQILNHHPFHESFRGSG